MTLSGGSVSYSSKRGPRAAIMKSTMSQIGVRVKVKVPLKVYHVPKIAEVDLTGMEDEIKQYIGLWKGKRISANLPYKVQFVTEMQGRGHVKFFAHLKEDEFDIVVTDLLNPAGQNLRIREDAQVVCNSKATFLAAADDNGEVKGRVYGVGKLNEGYLCRETFTQQTSSFATDLQKIIRLEEEIRQSREEFYQSREENQRLQRKLESLVNVVLPLLPPAAQIILQDMNEQPQNDHQNQNHAQEGEQHDGHSSFPHYAYY
ncbi:hypothetical protein Fmac_005895 [Flemingia macrophylla]|uniref:Ferredoxin thioredoxin reductase alpha chain domain-containing protein n=1 Tax=Flemingia macrophylla TaxID=520843 RepID=A0ABD1N933_9FABA